VKEDKTLKNKIINESKRGFILFSIIYALTTIISSSLQLFQGQPTDTNFHILNRAAVVLIAVITIILFDKIQLRSMVLSYLVPYAISMGIVFFYVWLTGFIEPLHPDAFRDVFLNFTSVAIFVMVVISIKDKWKRNKNKSGEKEHTLPQ
jgi:hypothetical protein